jgi:hypothetical protein
MSSRFFLVIPIALIFAACNDRSFDFAIIGDVPYGEHGWELFPNVVDALNAADVEWVMHVGDIKSGSVPCTDSLLVARHAGFQRIRHPFVYVPGDNEWTDCHRERAGGFDPLERLSFLRPLFYPEPGMSGGTPSMAVDYQGASPDYSEFVEHQRWVREGIVFVLLHVVGSQNGLLPFEGRTEEHDAEVERREAAAVVWMRESFALARELDSPGILFGLQATLPFPNPFPPSGLPLPEEAMLGFDELIAALEAEVLAFDRPVLWVHGDTHYFRMDKPLFNSATDRRFENFTRLETFGAPDFHWIKVRVDPADPAVFLVEPRLIPANIEGYTPQ